VDTYVERLELGVLKSTDEGRPIAGNHTPLDQEVVPVWWFSPVLALPTQAMAGRVLRTGVPGTVEHGRAEDGSVGEDLPQHLLTFALLHARGQAKSPAIRERGAGLRGTLERANGDGEFTSAPAADT
jgi:hypothetical protein